MSKKKLSEMAEEFEEEDQSHPPVAPPKKEKVIKVSPGFEVSKELEAKLHPPKSPPKSSSPPTMNVSEPVNVPGTEIMIEKMNSLESKLTSLDSKLNAVLGLDLPVIKEALHRANSTIKNKPQIERKEGKYYRDHVLWTHELEKIEEIEQGSATAYREVMKEFKEQIQSRRIEE